ncbi:AAA family ATPase [Pedomonas mirosovicensis]|uniref:AAA family ATPase n=1 Tax=Pedomonas mirosovicensis TaxID=2908641 RepID=UPI002168F25C|nr:AAA family ATPase [Pedomonas mirosovicensis]MCH8685029.1 AAA family ATPase [Pedomonas mirosovicensis]
MGDNHCDRLFVITGGPGSGKTSLVEALSARGLTCAPEAGRAIIQDQVAIDGQALPWADRRAFAELMLGWELRSHRMAQNTQGPVIFDRGVPDVAGYLRLCGLPVPSHVDRAAQLFRYSRQVFFAPPWREIFRQDSERKQTWNEAVRTYEAMVETYIAYGYEPVSLPCVSLAERVAFVQARLSQLGLAPA